MIQRRSSNELEQRIIKEEEVGEWQEAMMVVLETEELGDNAEGHWWMWPRKGFTNCVENWVKKHMSKD